MTSTRSITSEGNLAKQYYPFGMVMPGREYSSGENKFGFNGKKEETELNNDYYDFGERIYNAMLGRWLADDPLKFKTPGSSGYSGMNNCPILYIDPDGLEVFISGSPEERAAIFSSLQKLTRAKLILDPTTGKVTVEKSRKLLFFIKPFGTAIVRDLVESNKTVTIEKSDRNHTEPDPDTDDNWDKVNGENGKSQEPVNSKVYYNPSATGEGFKNRDGSKGRPSFIGLGHELIHAWFMIRGKTPMESSTEKENRKKDPDSNIRLPKSEVEVRRLENKIRRENFIKKRATPKRTVKKDDKT